jgi:hypothetical protein
MAGEGGDRFRAAGESAAESVAEGGEDLGEGVADGIAEVLLEAAGIGSERGEIDDEGAGGEFGWEDEVLGDGDEDGAAEELLNGFAAAGFGDGDAGAGGEATERVAEVRSEAGDVIEGEHPILAGKGEELAGGARGGCELGDAGIDEHAENAGGERFAGRGGAAQDEDGEGALGAEGTEQPGEAAKPGGGIGGAKTEKSAEVVESIGGGGVGGLGREQGEGGVGGFEGRAVGGGDAVAGGIDFDELTGRVGEVDVDFGVEGGDAAGDGNPDVVFFAAGFGFEVAADGGELVVSGDALVFAEGDHEEPVAEGVGAG